MAEDTELINLRQQAAFKQALILDRLEQLKEGIAQDDLKLLADLSEKVARDIERFHKLEHGEKFVLQVHEVQAIVQQITIIIQQEVKDERVVKRVAERLKQLKW